MRPRLARAVLWLFVSIAAGTPAWAQSPFAGTWKLNQDKSQMTGATLKFSPAAGDAIELTAGGLTYSFRTDGKTYAVPSGDAAIWRQTGPDSWNTEYRKLDTKLLKIDTWKLSADGNGLSVISSGARPNGDLYTNTEDYVRVSGTSGLMGAWKTTAVKLSSPSELIMQEAGLDRLILKMPALKASTQLNFDGAATVVEGPDIPSGLRLSLSRTGPYSFRLVEKLNGAVVSSSVYTVSAEDPLTMTEVGGAPGDPAATLVWEKQAPPAPAKTETKPDTKAAPAEPAHR